MVTVKQWNPAQCQWRPVLTRPEAGDAQIEATTHSEAGLLNDMGTEDVASTLLWAQNNNIPITPQMGLTEEFFELGFTGLGLGDQA